MLRRRRLLLGATLVLAAASVTAALGHEGHDHGAPPPAVTIPIAPRAEASSEQFELVTVQRGDRLAILLDRFATNEPVVDAVIEVETPQGSAAAEAQQDGTYALPAPWAVQPGKYDLIFTVAAGDQVDVLALTLVVPPAPAPQAAPPSMRDTIIALLQRLTNRVGDSEIALAADGENRLAGTASVTLPVKPKGAVQITTAKGESVQAKY